MGPASDTRGEDAASDARILREHVASLYFNYQPTLVARSVFVCVIAAFIYLELGQPLALPYLAAHLLLYGYLYRAPRWTEAEPVSASGAWVRRLAVIVTLMGILDGLGAWLFVPAHDLPATAVLTVVMLGNSARAAQSLRALRRALLGYLLPAMLGLAAALAAQADRLHLFLAAFVAVNLAQLLRVALKEHGQLTTALLLRFEKEALADQLALQIEATQQASLEKTRFLASASHDLRQPLHAIALFGAALAKELRHRPEGADAERLMRAVQALGASLDAMLDISRLDAGIIEIQTETVRLDALFLPLAHTFTAQAEQKALQLRLRSSGLWVRSDRQLLHRMLSNLIDNALKYTRAGGVVVAARARGDRVWIEVRDTGIGIATEQLGRIFEEFYQIGNPERDRERGLGIGLSIVRRLSRLLGHPIEVRSRSGHGSVFRIVLPRAAPEARGPVPHPAASLDTGTPTLEAPTLAGPVLLVDDQAEIRDAMTGLLRSCGIEVQAVADEASALRALEEAEAAAKPFALMVCDYRLADSANGLEAGLRLRERPSGSIPMLLITGETAPERLQTVRDSAVPVLFKPVDARTLLHAMTRLAPATGTETETEHRTG